MPGKKSVTRKLTKWLSSSNSKKPLKAELIGTSFLKLEDRNQPGSVLNSFEMLPSFAFPSIFGDATANLSSFGGESNDLPGGGPSGSGGSGSEPLPGSGSNSESGAGSTGSDSGPGSSGSGSSTGGNGGSGSSGLPGYGGGSSGSNQQFTDAVYEQTVANALSQFGPLGDLFGENSQKMSPANLSTPQNISLEPPLPPAVNNNWSYSGQFQLSANDSSTGPTSSQLNSNLNPTPINVSQEISANNFKYSREIQFSGNRENESFLMSVIIDSTVSLGQVTTEAGTIVSTVWHKVGNQYLVNQQSALSSFNTIVPNDPNGNRSYVGFPAQGDITPNLDPRSYGLDQLQWDHIFRGDSVSYTYSGIYRGNYGDFSYYSNSSATSNWLDLTIDHPTGTNDQGLKSVVYTMYFGGSSSKDCIVSSQSSLLSQSASANRIPIRTGSAVTLPEQYTTNVSGTSFFERSYSWQNYGGHSYLTDSLDADNAIKNSTLDFRNQFSGGSGYQYYNSSICSIITNSIDITKVSRTDYSWLTNYASRNNYAGYVDYKLNYDSQNRPSGQVVQKMDSVDILDRDIYNCSVDYFSYDPLPNSGHYEYYSDNMKPIVYTNGNYQTTTYAKPVETASELASYVLNYGRIPDSDGRLFDTNTWYSTADTSYQTRTFDRRQNKFNQPGRTGKPYFGSSFESNVTRDDFYVEAKGVDDLWLKDGVSTREGNYLSQSINTYYGQGTPEQLPNDIDGSSAMYDWQQGESRGEFREKYLNSNGTSKLTSQYASDLHHSSGNGWNWGYTYGPKVPNVTNYYQYSSISDEIHTLDLNFAADGKKSGDYHDVVSGSLDEKYNETKIGNEPTYYEKVEANKVLSLNYPDANTTLNDSSLNEQYQFSLDDDEGHYTADKKNGNYQSKYKSNSRWDQRIERSSSVYANTLTNKYQGTINGSSTSDVDETGIVLNGIRTGAGELNATLKGTERYNQNKIERKVTPGENYSGDDKLSYFKEQKNGEKVEYQLKSDGSFQILLDTVNLDERTKSSQILDHKTITVNRPHSSDLPEGQKIETYKSQYDVDYHYTKEGKPDIGRFTKETTLDWTESSSTVMSNIYYASYIATLNSQRESNSRGKNYSFYSGWGDEENPTILSIKEKSFSVIYAKGQSTNLTFGSNITFYKFNQFSSVNIDREGVPAHGTGSQVETSAELITQTIYGTTTTTSNKPLCTTTTDLSWPQTTWFERNTNAIVNTAKIAFGLIEVIGGALTTFGTCGGGVVPGVFMMANGLDSIMTGVAGLLDGQSYGSAIGYAASQGLQKIGVPENVADVAGELLPIAMSMGSSALARACFAADTKLWTPTGYRPIQSIKAGEYVYSRNDADPNGPIEPKLVEETFSRLAVIFHLHVENQVIRTTGEHPFYAEGKGWVDAQELLIGDRVLGSKGEWLTIRDLLDTGEFETVYNMRIADHHTYFVGDESWGWEVWSHNKCQLHHFVMVALGSKVERGSSILTLIGSRTHIAIHRALSKHLETYSKYSPKFGKTFTMNPKKGQSGDFIRSVFSPSERIQALKDFYSTYRGGRYLKEFMIELDTTLKRGLFI
ncbi:hypothetical protein KIH39_21200 [Telmatocola sphagniphila]|uniref:Hint domain-containing protein n=1 Tax=Telmatocola sphagniphila TaxID=1123043 RepID=A0A8E6ESU0_9BACT|nr:polymorphic toxin-type HINT domain-containing protein [Telmatocola sphagniphila]QVL31339.1 hypothetical protein KIH39_21200 [Telmatocola sphagniphila]